MAFNYFQGFNEKKTIQPLILFLTKKEENPNVQNLFQLVTKEFFVEEMYLHINFQQTTKKFRNFLKNV